MIVYICLSECVVHRFADTSDTGGDWIVGQQEDTDGQFVGRPEEAIVAGAGDRRQSTGDAV